MKYGLNLTWKQLQEAPGAKELVTELLPALGAFLEQTPGRCADFPAQSAKIRTAILPRR